jgi:hypothetical protein
LVTRRTYSVAIAERAELVQLIQDFGPRLEFEQCLQLCGDALREQYLLANRVVCLLEQQILDAGRAYRTKAGGIVWRTQKRRAT